MQITTPIHRYFAKFISFIVAEFHFLASALKIYLTFLTKCAKMNGEFHLKESKTSETNESICI